MTSFNRFAEFHAYDLAQHSDERNKPAAFGHSLRSLLRDFVMFRQITTGRIRI